MPSLSLPVELFRQEPLNAHVPENREILTRACGFREFLRANFGLYHPPGDYKALRKENQRRHNKYLQAHAGLVPPR